jgi:ribose 5-phosphate isomerase B
MSRKIAIGGDHAGYEFKEKFISLLKEKGFEVHDFGPNSADSVDYPEFYPPTM